MYIHCSINQSTAVEPHADFKPYNELKSEDPKKKEAALFSIKQIWMDNVDIKRGQGSINALAAGNLQFVTLRDAFMVAKNLDSVDDMDLNERVKRILKQRISEFEKWMEESEKSLRQRYEIEKHYLKTQVNTVKLYSRWVKPYLKAARALEQRVSPQAALVTTFNTMLLELTLLSKSNYNPIEDVKQGILPDSFKKAKVRKYFSILLVELKFRGIPQKTGQHFTFGGRTEMTFTSYSLNEQELEVFKKFLEEDDFGDILNLIEGATTESLDKMREDIEEFLEEDNVKNESPKKYEDVNPFTSLFAFVKKEKQEKKEVDLSHGIKSDNIYEKVIRSQAIIDARSKCFDAFKTYKKAHDMPSYYSPYESV